MSDPTAPVEGTPASTEAAPEAVSDPYAPVLDRVNELASTLDGRFAALEQRFQPEPEPEPDPWAALFPEADPEEQDPYALQNQMAQGLDPQQLQAAFQQALQQAQAPLLAQMQDLQTQRAHEQLVQRIPQLADTPENAEIRQATAQRVQQAIQAYPPHVQQALMNDAGYIETVFKAAEAEKLAQGQAPASEQVPSLEAAGGAVPGGDGTQPSYVNQAMNGAWSLPKGLR